uniref:TLC domain-containing protein 2 n=1 Tax=Lygus hesperus TaxID=30085 RepID=A0A0A9VU59_LYGHE
MTATAVEQDVPYFDQYSVGYLTVVASSLLFYVNNYWLMRFYTPEIVKSSAKREWKWRNIANSLIHSFITGIGACLCFYYTPEMRKDLVGPINLASQHLISFSIGYFTYDMLDMAMNDRKSKTYELLLHHFMVILCFSTAVTGRTYQGYSLMALLVEVNSIFLHVRQLMILTDFSKNSVAYRVNNSLNMGTFVVCRILTLGWMSRWLIHNRNDTSSFIFYLSGTSLTIIMGMNTTLLHRLLKADYWQYPKPATTPTQQTEENRKIR